MRYALVDCNLIDGTLDCEVQPGMTILVDGDTITAIQPGSDSVDPAYQVMDLKGAYVMPGMINLHSHQFGTGKPAKSLSGGSSQKRLLAFARTPLGHAYLDLLAKNAVTTELKSGVTTLRGVGDIEWADVRTRNKINAGKLMGPRFMVSGPAMTVSNGHGANTFARVAETPDEFRALVRDNQAHGVDFIKICVTGGVMDSTVKGQAGLLRMNVEQTKAVCDEAHSLGMKVASHTEGSDGVEVALEGGVDTIEHGSGLSEKAIMLYHENGSADICTISVALPLAKLPVSITMLDESSTYNSQVIADRVIAGARDSLKNDIPVGLGTDAGCPLVTHYSFWREVVNFVEQIGVTPAFALHTATQVNAQILGMDDVTGTIQVGKCADILTLANNPLDDPHYLRNIEKVMVRGRFVEDLSHSTLPEVDEQLDKIM